MDYDDFNLPSILRTLQKIPITKCFPLLKANLSTISQLKKVPATMRSCRIYGYGGIDNLSVTPTLLTPTISHPNQLLVRVLASSLNPIDLMMLKGYGSSLFNSARRIFNVPQQESEFPLILGRDFSGVVVSTGRDASKLFSVGEEVFGATWPYIQGFHSDYATVDAMHVTAKPKNLSHIESSSLPYAGLTAYTSLQEIGSLDSSLFENAHDKKVLILGASGGVGCLAVQMAVHWGYNVTCTCPDDAVLLMESFGPDMVIPRSLASDTLHRMKFDFILDCARMKESDLQSLLVENKPAHYVMLNHPLIKNFDKFGTLPGLAQSALDFFSKSIEQIPKRNIGSWSFFRASGSNLAYIVSLVEKGAIRPTVDKVFPFENIADAYRHLQDGNKRGKTVVDLS